MQLTCCFLSFCFVLAVSLLSALCVGERARIMAPERGGGTPVTLTYRSLRGVFTAGLKGFYNTVEVRVLNAVPCVFSSSTPAQIDVPSLINDTAYLC